MSTNEPPQYPDYGSVPAGQNPPPPPSYPPPGAPGGYYAPQPQTSGKATWSMILGILSLLCCGLLGIASIIMGQQAKGEIARSNGALTGQGQAQAGFVLGIIGLVLTALIIIFYVGLFAAVGTSSGFSEY